VSTRPLLRIPVGVVVERRKSTSRWVDESWRPLAVLPGAPDTAPWTVLASDGDVTRYYAGAAAIDLYRSETENYLYNLASASPSLWVALRPTTAAPPYALRAVTADPTEGSAFTEVGDDLVEAVPMPAPIRAALEAFVAEHHVERPFQKRQRDRLDPEAVSYGDPSRRGGRDG
jgi:hypothetical protein